MDTENKSDAIRSLLRMLIPVDGSIPWLIYPAATTQIPKSVPLICTPIYAVLIYGAIKHFRSAMAAIRSRWDSDGDPTRDTIPLP